MAKFSLSGMVKVVRTNDKGVQTVTLMEKNGSEISIRSKMVDCTAVPTLSPVHVDAEIRAYTYQGKQYIEFESVTFRTLDKLPD